LRPVEAQPVLLAQQPREDAVLVLELRDLAAARRREVAEEPRCRAADRQDDHRCRGREDGLAAAPPGEIPREAQLPPPGLPLLGAKGGPGGRPAAFRWMMMLAVDQVVVAARGLRGDLVLPVHHSIPRPYGERAGGAVRPHLSDD